MDIERVREFIEVVNRASFSEAARAVGQTQPVISRHVAALESELGVRLLRRGGSVSPTLAGRVFLKDALAIISAEDQALNDMKRVKETGSQTIRVGTFIGYKPTDDLIAATEQGLIDDGHYIELAPADMAMVDPVRGLADGTYDVVLIGGWDPSAEHPSTDGFPVITEPLLAVVSKGDVLYKKDILNVHDLDGRDVIMSNESFPYFWKWLQHLFQERGVTPHYVIHNWASSTDLYSGTFGDSGVVIMYASALRYSMPAVQRGYRALRFADEGMRSTVSAVYRKDEMSGAVLDALAKMRDIVADSDMNVYYA